MEQQQKRGRLGLIALVVGVLAIGLVLGSGFGMMRAGGGPMMGGQRGQMWQQPQQPQQPGDMGGMRERHGDMAGMDGMRGGMGFEMRGQMGGHRGGPLGMIGGLFGMLLGLAKLAFWGLAIYLLVLVWRDRKRRGGGPGAPSAPGGSSDQSSARPGPEQPPYTGMTTSL